MLSSNLGFPCAHSLAYLHFVRIACRLKVILLVIKEALNSLNFFTVLLHTSCWQDHELASQEHSFNRFSSKPAISQLCHLHHFVYENVICNDAKHSSKAVTWVLLCTGSTSLPTTANKLDRDSLHLTHLCCWCSVSSCLPCSEMLCFLACPRLFPVTKTKLVEPWQLFVDTWYTDRHQLWHSQRATWYDTENN